MTADQLELWHQIDAFDIDGGPCDLPFAARLARENGWSRSFAERAVREYKRFVFLATTAGRPMCPSEQVDQVWHLHLTYTRSYWQRFCGEVLRIPLHHEPTRGGETEGRKHWVMYADTLAAYEEVFGESPPADLWPSVEQRFGSDLEVARVNRNDYWLVRKPRLARPRLAAASLLVAVVFAFGCAGNPFDTKGTDFLPILFVAWGMAYVLGLIVRRMYKGGEPNPDEPAPKLGPYEIAYLTGGRPRVLATALIRLQGQDAVHIAGDGRVTVGYHPKGADPVENAVFGALANQSGNTLDLRPLDAAVREAETSRFFPFAKLREEGLLPTTSARRLARGLPPLLCLGTLALVGLPRLVMGLQNARPSGYLVASLVILTIVTLITFARPIRRTRKGDVVLANLSKQNARLRTLRGDLGPADAPLAVALFGAAVLTGTTYAAMYGRISKYDASGSGGGCTTASGCSGGGGCGGGGCGGGGCGGCGGGGD